MSYYTRFGDILKYKKYMLISYINTKNIYPHDRHLIDGLRENGHTVLDIHENAPGIKKYSNLIKLVLEHKKKSDLLVIGFTSPIFAIIASFFSRKIIYNAVSSQYEANVISRDVKKYSLAALKWWVLDILSFHLPAKILLESPSQIEFIHKSFFVKKEKLIKSWTGVNEKEFFFEPQYTKEKTFTVLFRGRFLAESGIDTVIKTAKILEEKEIRFRIIGAGHLYREVNALMKNLAPKNIEMINETLPIETLREKMLQCHISLGQMANHPRLLRTLPCKLYETLALGLPYLTGRNRAVLELLTENVTCACANPGDPYDLADKILYLKNNQDTLNKIASQGFELYKNTLTSKKLAESVTQQLALK